jgi:glycosyltransferase involved in cell wall biosynthesis
MSPKVTFVVTSYNYEHYIAQAVDSLLGQTLRDIEVIVIDDASTDGTADVLARYQNDSRVRVVRHERNIGHISSHNEGIALARGDYVGSIDADDFATRDDAVARQVALFERYPDVGFVHCAHKVVDSHGRERSVSQFSDRDMVVNGLDEFSRLIEFDYVLHSGTLVRRVWFEKLGGYDQRLPNTADWDIWLRIATVASVGYVAEPCYAYRVHDNNMSHAKATPGQAIDENLLVVDRNFALLPPTAAELAALWRPTRRRALFLQLWYDLSHLRKSRAWRGLGAILTRSPATLLDSRFYTSFLRVLVLTLAGGKTYRRLYGAYAE